MSARTRHRIELPELDDKAKAKIVMLFRDHDITRTALAERYCCSLSAITQVLRDAGVAR